MTNDDPGMTAPQRDFLISPLIYGPDPDDWVRYGEATADHLHTAVVFRRRQRDTMRLDLDVVGRETRIAARYAHLLAGYSSGMRRSGLTSGRPPGPTCRR